MNRVTAADFERMYAEAPDPWGLESSDYETRKYAATFRELEGRRYPRALEVGCALGVFTAMLARCCGHVVALDFSPAAVAMTRRRVADRANVEVVLAAFPEQTPAGPWDLVVCSEVLYYLDRGALHGAIAWFAEQLAGGATLVTAHWRGTGAGEPMTGDEVHDQMSRYLRLWHARDTRQPGYRLDRFDGTRNERS